MEAPRGPGYDDWFDEPEAPTETQSGANRGVYEDAEEVWVLPEEEDGSSPGQREFVIAGRTLTATQLAIIGLSAIAIILAIVAATGAFNSNPSSAPPVSTPRVRPPATTASTPTNTTPNFQAPSQTLSFGATGSQVKTLQEELIALGYLTGTADGDYGQATQAAVGKFQAAKGLTQDGVVGPATLAALQSAASG